MPAHTENLATLSLDDIAKQIEGSSTPPVETWHPEREGTIDIVITRDGRWIHEGRPIERRALVRLFSTILRREPDGSYVLVTPAEKLALDVEDAPFVAVEMKSEGSGRDRTMAFRLNTGDLVAAGSEHPIRLRKSREGHLPYLHVRKGLEALIGRNVYYELADLALAEGHDPLGLWSGGAFFTLDPEA